MDYHNMQHREGIFSEDLNKCGGMELNKIDPYTLQQIEYYLQQQHGVYVPAIIFEYLQANTLGKENFIGWDYEDLYDFFSHFGEIENLEIYGKISVVLFKTFFDANTAREFLTNSSNFKESEKNNFKVRWFNMDDEGVLSELMRAKMSKCMQRYYEIQNSIGGMGNMGMGIPNMNNMNNINNFNSINTLNTMNSMNNPILSNIGNMNNMNNISCIQGNNLNQGYLGNSCVPGMKMNPIIQMNQNMGQNINQNIGQTMSQNLKLQNMNALNSNFNNIANSPTPNQYQYYMMVNENSSTMINKKNLSSNQVNNNSHNNIPNTFMKKNSGIIDNDKEDRKSSISGNMSVQSQNSSNNMNINAINNNNGNLTNNGKYTCRFEIQIENDKEFQVARRLIGAKGCNMKRIVEMCSKCQDGSLVQDAVKLRLRGKGSGYKEGPFNKESEEPLHLCISSKFFDRYKMAIQLVNDLVSTVYEEYKVFCNKVGKTPVAQLAIRKEEGISSRKNTLTRSENE